HPTTLTYTGADQPMPGSTGGPAAPPFNPALFAAAPQNQEYWARRDRQQMARDIYVMLYTLGGENDSSSQNNANTVNFINTPNTISSAGPPVQRRLYFDWQLKEMAQFAANYVDALDRDDVITKFEYDKDLSNGWNLDDDPYGPPGNDTITG